MTLMNHPFDRSTSLQQKIQCSASLIITNLTKYQEREPNLLITVDPNVKQYYYLLILDQKIIVVYQDTVSEKYKELYLQYQGFLWLDGWMHSLLGYTGVTRLHVILIANFQFPLLMREIISDIIKSMSPKIQQPQLHLWPRHTIGHNTSRLMG